MRLYYTVASQYARVVRIALIESGLAPEVDMRLLTRDQLYSSESEIWAVTATGRVPTLVIDDGTVLSESTMILEFIIARTGHLGAANGPGRWKALASAGRAKSLIDGLTTWVRALPHADALAAVIEREQRRAARTADAIDQEITDYGDELDVTQIVIGCALSLADARLPWPWREGRPQLAEWYGRVSKRESFSSTVPPPAR